MCYYKSRNRQPCRKKGIKQKGKSLQKEDYTLFQVRTRKKNTNTNDRAHEHGRNVTNASDSSDSGSSSFGGSSGSSSISGGGSGGSGEMKPARRVFNQNRGKSILRATHEAMKSGEIMHIPKTKLKVKRGPFEIVRRINGNKRKKYAIKTILRCGGWLVERMK